MIQMNEVAADERQFVGTETELRRRNGLRLMAEWDE